MIEAELLELAPKLRSDTIKKLATAGLAITSLNEHMEIVYAITDRGRRAIYPVDQSLVAQPRRPVFTDIYDGAELKPFEMRPGANDALMHPSLISGERRWRDGRRERVKEAA